LDGTTMPEAPFGEMYGYMGKRKAENFIMNVTRVTHRKDPWFLNQFTGATRGYATAPTAVLYNDAFSKMLPGFIELHSPVDVTGLTFIRIDKTKAGQGLKIGQRLAAIIPIFKIVVVVDKDVDVLNTTEVLHAMTARWQPYPASKIMEEARGMTLDPSSVERGVSSKIVIDATMQFPEEGGPEDYAKLNRTLLEEGAPDSFASVQKKWGALINRQYKNWK
ncbi:MAG: UbiD family decarboxylase domain-containing protein, partial [Gammaproteobacteria bacterium]